MKKGEYVEDMEGGDRSLFLRHHPAINANKARERIKNFGQDSNGTRQGRCCCTNKLGVYSLQRNRLLLWRILGSRRI